MFWFATKGSCRIGLSASESSTRKAAYGGVTSSDGADFEFSGDVAGCLGLADYSLIRGSGSTTQARAR